MVAKKRGQISTEYLIIIGFIIVIVITVLGIAMLYVSQVQDTIKFDQLEKSSRKIIFAAETAFFDGEPARSTLNAYFPEGIETVEITQNNIVFTVSSSSGTNVIAFPSSVPIEGTLTTSPGLKKIQVVAQPDKVIISEVA